MGVTIDLQEKGNGTDYPKAGDKLSMHYVGTLQSDGSKFDSSRDKGKLFEFTIGQGQVIKGWDEGVMKMSLGERSILHISSDYGYGARGHPPVIPASADLDFDVELVKINGKKGFYSSEEATVFRTKLESWRTKQLAKYDAEGENKFKEKKNAKYENREGFKKYLDDEVETSCAAVQTK
ncbi:hypothetical protein ScalyP_jg6426 [Parmales sp. scaly parma]|nr:hypothetical protein ScalyP_jg6426 [Parmales sp. scaly parma]